MLGKDVCVEINPVIDVLRKVKESVNTDVEVIIDQAVYNITYDFFILQVVSTIKGEARERLWHAR